MGISAVFNIQFFRHSKTILRGKGVYLRAPRRRDQREWMNVRRVSKEFLQPWEPTWPADGAGKAAFRRRLRRFTEDWNSGNSYPFFILNRETDDLLGGITLSNLRRGVTQTATVGYWMGLPYARRGHMAEAVNLVLDYAFDDLHLHRVEAACLVHNEPSEKLLLKLGFTAEGVARQYLCIDGRWQDHRTFGILQADRRAQTRTL
jgi:ribosomal-protein-alanine N-acetyltransferase